MERTTLALSLLLAILGVCGAYAPERKCRTVFTDLNKRELDQINICIKSLGFKSGREKSQKSACTLKCVLQNEGMIQKDGQITAGLFEKYIEQHFPESLAKRADDTFRPCLDQFSGKNIDQSDEFCKAYDPFFKCLRTNFNNLCRGLP